MRKALIFVTLMFLFALIGPSNAWALKGDWELGGAPSAFIMPARDVYGAGAELYGRYDVLDGLSIHMGAGFYGAQQTELKYALGLYTLRAGIFYALDVLQWVPGIGLNISALFSEDDTWKWHRDGYGMGLDLDIYVQYRGIRQLGIGIFFGYHFTFADQGYYLTTGISISWYSGMF